MKAIKEDFIEIYRHERGIILLMIFNFLISTGLCIFSLNKLNPSSPVVKVGYGDIGGYRDGSWFDMFAFPILAIILGVFHNLIAIRIFKKRGAGMAKFFLLTTTILIAGAFIVLLRLLEKF